MIRPEHAHTLSEKHSVLRVLKFLIKGPARQEGSIHDDQYLLTSETGGTIAVDKLILARLLGLGYIHSTSEVVVISGSGREQLVKVKDTSDARECAAAEMQRNNLDLQRVNVGGQVRTVVVNISESPLALLYRSNKQSGRRFLSDEEFEAGERLRADFTRGNMLPRVTADWGAGGTKRLHGERGGVADLSDHALDCRDRVDKALKAVGPELSGVLLDICCFLKGLELVERERSWPARSAKMLLKTALSILHRHYTGTRKSAEENTSACYHWGDRDYRPSL